MYSREKVCKYCSKNFNIRTPGQRYCLDCREIATKERKSKNLKLFYQKRPNYRNEWLKTESGRISHEKYLRSETKRKLNEKWRKSKEGQEYVDEYSRNWNRKKRLEIIKKLGGKCIQCGFSDWRALQVDHKDGGGSKERKGLKTVLYLRIVLKNEKNKYQLLCANCNWIKRYEKNECKIKII